MDDIIKSAREIAMEKIEKIGKPTDEERLKWKYVPEGEKLAFTYLEQDVNLIAELSQYEEKARKYIAEGATAILTRNISLPTNELANKNNRKAMDGIKSLKTDKVGVENVYSRIRNIFKHYTEQGEQQKKQAYASLKTEFGNKVQQALRQQLGTTLGMKIDVEKQPEFQAEWHRVQTQLNSQYHTLLNEYKQELLTIP